MDYVIQKWYSPPKPTPKLDVDGLYVMPITYENVFKEDCYIIGIDPDRRNCLILKNSFGTWIINRWESIELLNLLGLKEVLIPGYVKTRLGKVVKED